MAWRRWVVGLTVGVLIATALVAPETNAAVLPEAGATGLLERARALGSVTSMEAVSTTSAGAQAALDPSYVSSGNTADTAGDVSLVVFQGNFTDTLAKVPAGESPPTGTTLAFIVTGDDERPGVYIGNRAPSLASLGAVERINIGGTKASMSSRVARVRMPLRRAHHPTAHAATWGNSCKLAEEHHCYAQSSWIMGGSEQVLGAVDEVNTSSMNVPQFAEGAFVDDEMWVGLGSGSNGAHWMEIGQEGGSYRSCCSLWWFRAYQNNLGYYELPPAEGWEISFNGWANYGVEGVAAGEWCWYIGAAWEVQDGCRANFPTTSKLLTDGMEVDSNSEPANAANIVVAASHTDGKWYTWNKSTNESINSKGEFTTHTCVSGFAGAPAPGNINVSTC